MGDSIETKLVKANRILANEGIIRRETGLGHVSVREPGSDEMLITLARSPAMVTTDDVIRMNLDGTIISETDRDPYLENVIHRAIYRRRDDVNAIVHHHAPAIMPFAITGKEWKTVFHDAALFHDGVPLFEEYDPAYGRLIVSEEEANRMAETLSDHRAQLLLNHGANVVGQGIKEAILSTMFFVINAEYQYQAELFGDPIEYDGPPESVESMVDDSILVPVVIDRMWEVLTSRLSV